MYRKRTMKIWILLAILLLIVLLVFFPSREGLENENELVDVTCPADHTFDVASRMCVFSKDVNPTCASGTLQDGFCIVEGGPSTSPTCPSDMMLNTQGKCISQSKDPICPPGYIEASEPGKCRKLPENSTTAIKPTQQTKLGQFVFGPAFVGLGEVEQDGGDSSRTTQYPELLGGMVKPAGFIEGVGVVPPTQSLEGLPKPENTGSAPGSQFFPTSRVPGDMDLIPDPYRVSQTFSTSTYSSKTEPVPFLTDFSAFLK